MSVASTRQVVITQVGDNLNNNITVTAAGNAASPGDIDVFGLVIGPNTITLPTGGTTPKGATIVPPSSNTQTITLKGVAGDTGIALHKTDPTSISFDSPPPVSFVLAAGGTIDGLRVIWT